jgi:hypothetical protein
LNRGIFFVAVRTEDVENAKDDLPGRDFSVLPARWYKKG